MDEMEYRKKIIEVALPLDAINRESAREKSIRHGHPSTLHLWWARRPLAAARAVIFSSLVDDPSSHPEQFPTEEAQAKERKRLFDLIEELVVWENSNDLDVLARAKAEIFKSTGGNPPPLLDPFAGGGSIPLEAQRLGLESHASDLNPVAVMINKAMFEIPPKFAGMPPVNPKARMVGFTNLGEGMKWQGTMGLAEDVRYYGEWMKEEAFHRIDHLYPKVTVPIEQGGGEATAIAWIWARTVKCPNPACGCEMPLVRSFALSTKKGSEAYVLPVIDNGRINYAVRRGKCTLNGTVNRRGTTCIRCGSPAGLPYIRQEGQADRMGSRLIAIVGEGQRGRVYVSPNNEHVRIANIEKPDDYPDGEISHYTRDFRTHLYGLTHFSHLFTNRQLTTLTAFSDLVKHAQAKATEDAIVAGMLNDNVSLSEDGKGALAYGQAIGVYLAFTVDKLVDYHSSICIWHTSREIVANTMRRQAIQMTWDFAEANPFSNSSGCFLNMLDWVVKCLVAFQTGKKGYATQGNAQHLAPTTKMLISTDPPYYDNIGYADLSDYFYVWLRKSLYNIYPDFFKTILVPKSEELVATPFRFGGDKTLAKIFYEQGMMHVFGQIYHFASDEYPATIYYAFKQSESEISDISKDGSNVETASTGWETMLSAIIHSGFQISGTWPIRTELITALKSTVNALASSIVIVCRKRSQSAPICSRRDFVIALKNELAPALHELQQASIAPVDLAQSAIGPGMAVYSRYSQVLEPDGKPVDVRSALQLINQELDACLTEQEGMLDSNSRFCVAFYTQYAFNSVEYGIAEVLSKAKNVTITDIVHLGILSAEKGVVTLNDRDSLPNSKNIAPNDFGSCIWLQTQVLTRDILSGGNEACADTIHNLLRGASDDGAKALAYRLYTIAEQRGWPQEAFAYNTLILAWQDIQDCVAQRRGGSGMTQKSWLDNQ
ncbi:MAG: DUF1156 domain-containing protein [Desulfovibrio sp.]|nr:DUF1156 domain-containing protein [Desulfovibrio sp.]